MPSDPYIPRADAAFRSWAQVFCTKMRDQYSRYGSAAAPGQWLMRCYEEFDAAYQLAKAPETRTRSTIAEKDDARLSLEGLCRRYAAFIRANHGITDGDKIAIGVRPRNVALHKRTCPQSEPGLDFRGSTPGYDYLHFSDLSRFGKGKPYNAARVELWIAYSRAGEPRPKRSAAQYLDSYSKNPLRIPQTLVMLEQGLHPTYWARWAGHNNDTGPFSLPTSMRSAAIQAKRQPGADVPAELGDGDLAIRPAA